MDNTTNAAAESTKRPRDDADSVGGIDEDDAARKPPPKTNRTTGAGVGSSNKIGRETERGINDDDDDDNVSSVLLHVLDNRMFSIGIGLCCNSSKR